MRDLVEVVLEASVVLLFLSGNGCAGGAAQQREGPGPSPQRDAAAEAAGSDRGGARFCEAIPLPAELDVTWLVDLLPLGEAELLAVTNDGHILRHDRSGWTTVLRGSVTQLLNEVRSAGPGRLIAVGQLGFVRRFDGTAWSEQTVMREENLFGVAAREDGSAVVVTNSGRSFALRDGGYRELTTGTRRTLFDIVGTESRELFAVGDDGTILHFDGSAWTAQASGTSKTLFQLWASGPSDVIAVGREGTILRYDGAAWSSVESGAESYDLRDVWGTGPDDVYVVGRNIPPFPDLIEPDHHGILLHWDGTAWRRIGPELRPPATTIAGVAPNLLFLAGSEGQLLRCDLRQRPAPRPD